MKLLGITKNASIDLIEQQHILLEGSEDDGGRIPTTVNVACNELYELYLL